MATARIVLDTRRVKSNGLYPIKIRIAHVKDFERFGTTFSLSEDDFTKLVKGKNLNEELKPIKKKTDALIEKANGIIENLEPFDFVVFKTRFLQKGNRSDLIFLLQDKAAAFGADEKYSSQNLYNQTAEMLSAYINHDRPAGSAPLSILPVSKVTPKWLAGLEKWSLAVTYDKKVKGKKQPVTVNKYNQTTLGMYLIRVRSIFNDIISAKELSPNAYPFHKPDNKTGYKIPDPINNKRSLDLSKIIQMNNYLPATPGEQFSKDIFMFSYLASGMNMIDIFRLKWADIKNNEFSFVRKKTAAKTGGTNKISIPLNADLLRIIETHGTRKLTTDFIFDVIPADADEKELIRRTRIAITGINTNLKKIALKLGWEEQPSTYFARHAYSTNLMNREVPLAFISKQLGHKDLKTTQNYLGSFSTDKATEYHTNLLEDNKTA